MMQSIHEDAPDFFLFLLELFLREGVSRLVSGRAACVVTGRLVDLRLSLSLPFSSLSSSFGRLLIFF